MDSIFTDVYASDLDATREGFGYVETSTDYMLSPYFFADDKLRASFSVDLPKAFIPDESWVFQYM